MRLNEREAEKPTVVFVVIIHKPAVGASLANANTARLVVDFTSLVAQAVVEHVAVKRPKCPVRIRQHYLRQRQTAIVADWHPSPGHAQSLCTYEHTECCRL